jgi:BolA protein
MTTERVEMIRRRLTEALAPASLEIEDDSARHAGHPGARSGGGHFNVRIVSDAFTGRSLVERHRMVYDALGDAMHREIHALSIDARTPGEAGDA